MGAEVFQDDIYPPEATTGPVWSTATLRQIAEMIENVPQSRPKRRAQEARQPVETVADVPGGGAAPPSEADEPSRPALSADTTRQFVAVFDSVFAARGRADDAEAER